VFDYTALGTEHLQNVFKIFSECSAENPDEYVSIDEQDFLDNDFITADDIDEDGNVRLKNGTQDGEEKKDENEEDEDENGEEIDGEGEEQDEGKMVEENQDEKKMIFINQE